MVAMNVCEKAYDSLCVVAMNGHLPHQSQVGGHVAYNSQVPWLAVSVSGASSL